MTAGSVCVDRVPARAGRRVRRTDGSMEPGARRHFAGSPMVETSEHRLPAGVPAHVTSTTSRAAVSEIPASRWETSEVAEKSPQMMQNSG